MGFKYKQRYKTEDIDPEYYYSDAIGNKFTQQDLIKTGIPYYDVTKSNGTEEDYEAYANTHPITLDEIVITTNPSASTNEQKVSRIRFKPRGWSTNGNGIGVKSIPAPQGLPNWKQGLSNYLFRHSGGTYGIDGAAEMFINTLKLPFGKERYYNGTFGTNISIDGPIRTQNHNYINAYTYGDFSGMSPSKIGVGTYKTYAGGKFANSPAVSDTFYADTLYFPQSIEQDFLKQPIKGWMDKDEIILHTGPIDITGTYDAGIHMYTTDPKTSSIIFEDVFDINPERAPFGFKNIMKNINSRNTPIIVNQRVPVIFTNDSNLYNQFPILIEYLKDDLKK